MPDGPPTETDGDPSGPDAAAQSLDLVSRRPAAVSGQRVEPGLHIVSTPIGNLRDITLRALDVLGTADLLLAEDTRVTRRLLDVYGLKPRRVMAYHDHNGEQMRPKVLDALAAGEVVAMVTDAGTPLVSDPGFKLVRSALDAGHRVTPIPGVSAPIAALSIAGLPTDRFLFAGFPPAKSGARRSFFAEFARIDATLVFFESGGRIADSLADLGHSCPGREIVVARELTKYFEEAVRGSASDLVARYLRDGAPKGEIVLLAGPPSAPRESDGEAIEELLRSALQRLPLSAAVREVAAISGAPRNEVYAKALAMKGST
jgi:16S rRNA (cytidine1402-2'-O)-methyltransferase